VARLRWLSTTGVLPSGHRARLQRDIVDHVIQFSWDTTWFLIRRVLGR
jgi:hypothetical protein